MLHGCNGLWLSVSADGKIISIDLSEKDSRKRVKDAINTYEPGQCIYTNCIGREIAEEIYIGGGYSSNDHDQLHSEWIKLDNDEDKQTNSQ